MEIIKFNNYKNYQIFCDMDGVLTDFENRFINIPANTEKLSFDEYDEKYGKYSAWEIIEEEGIRWWSHMPWIKDGKKLWEFINKNNDVIICSSPSRSILSSNGKVIWIERELGIKQNEATRSPKRWDNDSRIVLSSQKYLFCNRFKNSILIDDTPKQINNWVNAGGIGILHTGDVELTINKIKDIVSKL